MNFLYFLGLMVLGFVCIIYAKWIKDNSGIRFAFAENFFGAGGTTTLIKIFGVIFVFGSFWMLFR